MENIEHYIDVIGYAGILVWFMTIDQVTPIPEEISLVSIGYLASEGILNPFLAGLFSLVALFGVDMFYYFLSRKGSKFIKKRIERSKSKFMTSYKKKLTEHMGKTVLVLCFIPRMRFWGPILIGTTKLPVKRFALFDLIGLAAFIALYISLGIIFHNSVHKLIGKLESLQNIIFISFLVIFGLVLYFISRKKGIAESAENKEGKNL